MTSHILQGAEIAVTGRFATMTQAAIGDLIRNCGGTPVRAPSETTRWLVVGQGGLPLDQDGRPTAALEKARRLIARGLPLQIITEESLLQELGMDRNHDGIHQRFTLVQLARILKLPGRRIQSWIKQGLIEPVETVHNLALFDFHQVAAARTLCDLVESGLPPAEIRRGLEQLRRLLPDLTSPLLQVSVLESTSRMLVRLASGRLAEPNGQLQLDFQEEAAEDPQSLAFIAVARSSEDLWNDAVSLEAAGRDEEAAETYRKALDRDAQNPVLIFNLGNVLYRLGRPEAAAAQFQRAVQIDPAYVEAWNNLGAMLYETGQEESAIAAIQRAVRLAPACENARSNLETVIARRYRCRPS